MKQNNKKVLFFSISYLIIFILLPFYFFIFSSLIKDLGWFFVYFLFIFPLTFIVFLILYKIKFKNKINYYKKLLLFFWIIFFILVVAFIFFTHYIINVAFQNFGF